MKDKFIEKEIKINGEFKLSSTLTFPNEKKDKYPAIIIVPGTGNSDRDGNSKNLNMNLYKLIAEYLTSIGYATIRYDKRGLHQSDGNFIKTGVKDLIDDIISVYNHLKENDEIDSSNIYLLGHSEGAILSTISSEDMNLKGLILLSGAGISLKTALSMQSKEAYEEIQRMKGLKGTLLKLLYSKNRIRKTQEKLYEKALYTEKDVFKFKLKEFPAKWLREHLNYSDDDILKLLKNKDFPILCITGDKDVQADPNDLNNVKKLNNDKITVKIIENMDHILRYYDGEKTIMNLTKQYKEEVDKPLHEDLRNSLKEWLINH
jgi:pimeloyl-ACP methyl ester carboxylesterase